jgi:hypothetical protein
MTYEQLVEEIKRLSIVQRVELLKFIWHSVCEMMRSYASQRSIDGTLRVIDDLASAPPGEAVDEAGKLELVRRLRGVFKTDGPPPSDDELKKDYANYLEEKYS